MQPHRIRIMHGYARTRACRALVLLRCCVDVLRSLSDGESLSEEGRMVLVIVVSTIVCTAHMYRYS